jgi:hypothetical protein
MISGLIEGQTPHKLSLASAAEAVRGGEATGWGSHRVSQEASVSSPPRARLRTEEGEGGQGGQEGGEGSWAQLLEGEEEGEDTGQDVGEDVGGDAGSGSGDGWGGDAPGRSCSPISPGGGEGSGGEEDERMPVPSYLSARAASPPLAHFSGRDYGATLNPRSLNP